MNTLLKRIWGILSRRERRKFLSLCAGDLLISTLDIVFLVVLLGLVGLYAGREHSAIISRDIIILHPLLPVFSFLIAFAGKNYLGFLISRGQFQFAYEVASEISKRNLRAFLQGRFPDYVHQDSSIVNRRISQQPIEFAHYVLNGIQQVFTQFVLIILTLTGIFLYKPFLSLLLFIFLIPPILLFAFLLKKKLVRSREEGKRASEKTIQHLQEAISGYIESNLYQKNDFFTNRFFQKQDQLNHYLSQRLTIQSLPTRGMEVFAVFGLFVLIVWNIVSGQQTAIPLATLGAFLIAAYKVIPGLSKMINILSQIRTYKFTLEGLAGPTDPITERDPVRVEKIKSIRIENIAYSSRSKRLIGDFYLNIFPGEMTGISGLSGRGKTTLINLLLGFLEPDSGHIYINNQVANAEARKSFWPRIAYVKQQPFFLHASIRENISLSEHAGDPKKMEHILKITGLDQLLETLPKGLETIVAENGKNFSGGQRQRLLFARALYKDCDLLVLDEPFGELDEYSEMNMLQALQDLTSEDKMVLLITHNDEALNSCDRIINMHEHS